MERPWRGRRRRAPSRPRSCSRWGATGAGTPAGAGERAEIVFSMVVAGPQVQEVLVPAAREGVLFVDMTTVGPAWTRRIAEQLAERGSRLGWRARPGVA